MFTKEKKKVEEKEFVSFLFSSSSNYVMLTTSLIIHTDAIQKVNFSTSKELKQIFCNQ